MRCRCSFCGSPGSLSAPYSPRGPGASSQLPISSGDIESIYRRVPQGKPRGRLDEVFGRDSLQRFTGRRPRVVEVCASSISWLFRVFRFGGRLHPTATIDRPRFRTAQVRAASQVFATIPNPCIGQPGFRTARPHLALAKQISQRVGFVAPQRRATRKATPEREP